MKIMVNIGFCFFITIMGMFPANTNTLSAQAHAASIKANPPGISTIVGLWKNTDHVHQGCRTRTAACAAYKIDLLFKVVSGGKLRAEFAGRKKGYAYSMVGFLKGQRWTYKSYSKNKYDGSGFFDFSPDFRSFQGEATNSDSSHHIVWTGRR
jgi:hypothetical protein